MKLFTGWYYHLKENKVNIPSLIIQHDTFTITLIPTIDSLAEISDNEIKDLFKKIIDRYNQGWRLEVPKED